MNKNARLTLTALAIAALTASALLVGVPAASATSGDVTVGAFTYAIDSSDNTATLTGWSGTEITTVVIPPSVTVNSVSYPVVEIGWCAFSSDSQYGGVCFGPKHPITSVTIPSSVTDIEGFAFTGSHLTSVDIPASVTYIGEQAFVEQQWGNTTIKDLLRSVTFEGNAPEMAELGDDICSPDGCGFNGHAPFGTGNNFIVYYQHGASGFPASASGEWDGYQAALAGSVPLLKGYGDYVDGLQVSLSATPVAGKSDTAKLEEWSYGAKLSPKPTTKLFEWQVYKDGTWSSIGTGNTITFPSDSAGGYLRIVTVLDGPAPHHAVLQLGGGEQILSSFTAMPTPTITLPAGITASTVTKGTVLGITGADVDSWTPSAGSLTYRWYRGSKEISGATKSTYKVTSADKGHKLKVRVTAHADGYEKSAVYSATLAIPTK